MYNLLVDIAVGIFTVWGLYWAASEFTEAQIKPDLRLIIGRKHGDGGIEPIYNETDPLYGYDALLNDIQVSQVIIGLFLDNNQTKAARYVRITLELPDNIPPPDEFVPVDSSFHYKLNKNVMQAKAIFLQFGDELVVYKGEQGVRLGDVCIVWPQDIKPRQLTFKAGLYSLESEPKYLEKTHPIEWCKTIPKVVGQQNYKKGEVTTRKVERSSLKIQYRSISNNMSGVLRFCCLIITLGLIGTIMTKNVLDKLNNKGY